MSKTPYMNWSGEDWELNHTYRNQEWAIKWLNKHKKELPIPKYNIGLNVEFFWNKPKTIKGNIENIGIFQNFNFDRGYIYQLCYDIRANGHSRSVYNEEDIIKWIQ
jgi:hypothetical protein